MGLFSVRVVVILAFAGFFLDSTTARTEPQDLAALISLRSTFSTSLQALWPLESVDPCDNLALYRYVFTCLAPSQPLFPFRIGGLNMNCFGLSGPVPSLVNFTALVSVDFSNNMLSGSLSASVFPPRVQVINLYNNSLTGTIPSFNAVNATLTSLSQLYLSRNMFSGTIPDFGGNLTVLSLASNNLTGTIPSSIFQFTGLTQLFLANNTLQGSIPAAIGSLTQLRILALWNCSLTGSIPSALSSLTSLRFLYLDRNSLTGAIPSVLAMIPDLRILYLRQNQLNGTIPSELGNLANLTALSLAINNLNGTIPQTLGNLRNLSLLHLYLNTGLYGTIPPVLGNLSMLTSLDLSTCTLNGTLPSTFANIIANSKFSFLNLAWNILSGNLSATFLATKPNISSSAVIDVRQNVFTCGTLPQWCSASGNGYCVTGKCLLAPPVTARPNVITGGKRALKSITLKWTPSQDLDSNQSTLYEAEMSERGQNAFKSVYYGAEAGVTVDGLAEGAAYLFRIRAISNGDFGPWSPALEAVVQ